eukprot:INCI10403.2.p1 GENE.INCI10403.2~~INCI10403.2.p1  ORF type:complete len:749 (+),score=115.39 INCI10403.2:815-3061(+)
MSAASLRPTTYAAVVRSDEGGGAIRERSSNGDGNTGHGHSHGRELEFEFESTHQPPAAVDGVGDRFGFSAASAQNNTRGEGPSFPMGGRARHRRLMEVKKRTSVVARSAKVRCAVIGAVTAAVFVAVVVVLAVLVPRADESGPLLFVTTSSSSLPASSTSTTGVLWTRSSNGSGPGSTVSHASTTSVPAASLPESGLEAATGQFLHFSDFHLDLLYDSAYNASCFCNKPEHKIIDSTNVWTTTGTVASSAVDSQCRVLYDQGVVGSHSSPMTTAEELATQVVGRHGCDSSEALVNKTLQHAYDMLPNPDFILVTGDYVRHYTDDLLGGGPARIPVILRTIERVGELIQAFFPAVVTHHAVEPYYELGNLSYEGADDVNEVQSDIINVLGNNDLDGDYNLPIARSQTESPWLARVAPAFFHSLQANQSATFRAGGFYSKEVVPGLHVISLNTVIYSPHHRPSNVTFADPFGQFAWLKRTLQALASPTSTDAAATTSGFGTSRGAQLRGSVAGAIAGDNPASVAVYIVGHIPPTVDQYSFTLQWEERFADQYYAIVDAFRDIVRGQLFGHVHCNTFRLLPMPLSGQALPVFVTTAITPIYQNNPGFRVWAYDAGAAQSGPGDSPGRPSASTVAQFGTLLNFTVYALSLTAAAPAATTTGSPEATAVAPGSSASVPDLEARIERILWNDSAWEAYVDQLWSNGAGDATAVEDHDDWLFRVQSYCAMKHYRNASFAACVSCHYENGAAAVCR